MLRSSRTTPKIFACGQTKSLLKEAIERGYYTENSFESIVSFTQVNKKLQFFIEASVAYDCINASPCIDW